MIKKIVPIFLKKDRGTQSKIEIKKKDHSTRTSINQQHYYIGILSNLIIPIPI